MSNAGDRRWPDGAIGNVAMGLALLLVVSALLPLHAGGDWHTTEQRQRWLWAGAMVLAYAALCVAWLRPRASEASTQSSANGADWLVAYASQTGFAHSLADRTAAALRDAGHVVDLRSLGSCTAETLGAYRRALFVASTTGEGDPPDAALAFVRDAMACTPALDGLRYGVLALGDRSYGHFCGFGHALDTWLRHCDARALFDLVEVDNAEPGALRHWQHHLGLLAGSPDLPDWQPPVYTQWRLAERRELNRGSPGAPCFHLSLVPGDGVLPSWQAGDIAEIGPRHAMATVSYFLRDSGHSGSASVRTGIIETTLSERLARSTLPVIATARAMQAQALSDSLQALPHREYSIASIPADGAVHLVLRQMRRSDGSLGLASGWLTEYAQPDDRVDMRIRTNPGFHPPADARPLLLVGNGTGIAGLRALLKTRIDAGQHRNWLLFGERTRAHDFHYGDEIERWRERGEIARVDLAFSRDGGAIRYVQDLLRSHAAEVLAWLQQGAAVYVCGSLSGMAPAVEAELARLVGRSGLERMAADGSYRRDVY